MCRAKLRLVNKRLVIQTCESNFPRFSKLKHTTQHPYILFSGFPLPHSAQQLNMDPKRRQRGILHPALRNEEQVNCLESIVVPHNPAMQHGLFFFSWTALAHGERPTMTSGRVLDGVVRRRSAYVASRVSCLFSLGFFSYITLELFPQP